MVRQAHHERKSEDFEKTLRRHGRAKKLPQSIGKSRGGWTTKIHMVAADARTAITFSTLPRPGPQRAGRA